MMNKEQAITLVDNILANSFDSGRFQTLIVELFNYGDHIRPKQTIPERFRELVAEVRLLNEDDSDLLILEVQLATSVSVERNRSLQRNLIAHYLNTMNKDAALVGFHVDNSPDQWRFSFVRRDLQLDTTGAKTTVKTDFSPVRRFSYLVGKGEQTHTAQKQLLTLLTRDDKKSIEIEDLQAAFDVEPVSKAFFNQYRSLFDDTHEALTAFLASYPDHKAHFDSHQIEPAEFAKRILAQIVFLYFLQRKGWLGVASGKGWGSGDRQFLRTMFEQREAGDSYYRSFLQPLFYEVLAYKRERDVYDRWNVRIPFLNGGLFEPWRGYEWQEQSIDLPDSLFSNADDTGILDIFDRYNFTVQEDDPVEREVAVDPEILGKVFENLIEENRRHASGTYYTPRSVVHYMCQEVLIDHLADRHPQIKRADVAILIREGRHRAEQLQWASEEGAAESRQLGLPRAIVNAAAALDASLKSVTICDPAVGSGAFPLGMLNEIIHARMALDAHLGRGLTEFNAKLHAINHSLYGVDLDGGAVEIAKLRLWLSLVVDEENSAQIQPLPNLDYKMMQGNSLIAHLDGMSLIDDSLLTRQLETPRTADGLRRQLVPLQRQALDIQQSPDAVTTETRKKLKELQADIRRLENRIARAEATPKRGDDEFDLLTEFDVVARTRQEFLALQQQFFKCTDTDEKRNLREQIDSTHDQMVIFSIEQDGSLSADEKAAALDAFNAVKGQYEKPYFLWQLDFNPVFAPNGDSTDEGDADVGTADAGGFDIVIGNPPYVNAGEIGAKQKDDIRIEMPEAYVGSADLYTYFYFRGLDILRPGGHLTYITSKTFMRGNFGERLRGMIASRAKIAEIVDVSEAEVFAAIAYPAIYRLQNRPPERSAEFIYGRLAENAMLSDITTALPDHSFLQRQGTIGADRWLLAPPHVQNLMSKLRRSGQTVGEYTKGKMHYGIKTGLNDAFVIDTPTRDALVAADPKSTEVIKRWIEGGDVEPWNVKWNGKWVIFTHHGIDIDLYPAIKKYLSQFRKDLQPKQHSSDPSGRKPGDYKWYEIQDTVAYHPKFEESKIVWGNLCVRPSFAYDDQGYYVSAPANIICNDNRVLLTILNSPVTDWFMRLTAAQRANGYLEYKPMYVQDLPLPVATELNIDQKLMLKAGLRSVGMQPDDNGQEWYDPEEGQEIINQLVYQLYDLDPAEIEIIERATGLRDDEVDALEVKAITFTHKISFPNLKFTDLDFSACCKSFSEAFASRMKDHVVEMFELNGDTHAEDVWGIQQINIRYDEKCWDIVIEILAAAGSFLKGLGQSITALNQREKITEEKMRQIAGDAARQAAADVIQKYILSDPKHKQNTGEVDVTRHSVSDGEFKTHANDNDARASLTKPEDIQKAQTPNRNIELHVLVPTNSAPVSLTIEVHSNKEDK